MPILSRNTMMVPLLFNAWVMIPLVYSLPLWVIVISYAILLFCLGRILGLISSYSLWANRFVAISLIVFIILEYKSLLGYEPAISFLSLMVCMKMSESASLRDLRVHAFMLSFLLLGVSLFGESILGTAHIMISIVMIFILFHEYSRGKAEWGHLKDALASVIRFVFIAAPIILAFFFLLPRYSGNISFLPGFRKTGEVGLSDSIRPGSIARLAMDDTVAFRARVVMPDGAPLRKPEYLYWRVLTLSETNGHQWNQGYLDRIWSKQTSLANKDNMIIQEIILEPQYLSYLPSLDKPIMMDSFSFSGYPGHLTTASTFLTRNKVSLRLKYRAYSVDHAEYLPMKKNKKDYLVKLSGNQNELVTNLVRMWSSSSEDENQYANKVLQYFSSNFKYTLEPGLYTKAEESDFLYELLFKKKTGFCEHFASAFALLMRMNAIPSRLVVGYQGGEYNTYGDYWVVRQRDAHVWVEVWEMSRGWVRIDPTFHILPERIINGSIQNNNQKLMKSESIIYKYYVNLNQTFDNLSNRWNKFLLNYDLHYQQRIIRKYFGFDAKRYHLVGGLLAILATFFLSIRLYYFVHGVNLRDCSLENKLKRYYGKLLSSLCKTGYAKVNCEDPWDYLQRVKRKDPVLADILSPPINFYIELKYGKNALLKKDLKIFRHLVKLAVINLQCLQKNQSERG